jgi:hypothetical protein
MIKGQVHLWNLTFFRSCPDFPSGNPPPAKLSIQALKAFIPNYAIENRLVELTTPKVKLVSFACFAPLRALRRNRQVY